MTVYSVKEIFYTLQGEGSHAGRPAVFCRFSGCNLWTGVERDRVRATCKFCDTDFVGTNGTLGGKYRDANELADAIASLWPNDHNYRFVVLTGGEPLLQVDEKLLDALHERSFEIAAETNGTIAPPRGIDWLCVSPKAGTQIEATTGNELKVVFPQPGLDLGALEKYAFDNFLLQPMDGIEKDQNTSAAMKYCQANPRWKMSIQLHKILGIR